MSAVCRCPLSRSTISRSCWERRRVALEAVRDVSFTVDRRAETLGIVGESGCRKIIAMLARWALLPPTMRATARSSCGAANWSVCRRRKTRLRGSRIAMIFQDPMTSLNPVMTGRRADR